MDKKVNSIEAGPEDLSAMKETLDKLEVAVLAKCLDRKNVV